MQFRRLSTVVKMQLGALLVSALGIVIQDATGVPYPPIPPGLVLFLAAAALIAFVPWRWTPAFGLALTAFISFGFVAVPTTIPRLFNLSAFGPFLGTAVQLIGLVVGLVAGVLAMLSLTRRPVKTSRTARG